MGECQGGIRQVDGVFFGPGGPVGELLLSDHQKSLLSGKITIKKTNRTMERSTMF